MALISVYWLSKYHDDHLSFVRDTLYRDDDFIADGENSINKIKHGQVIAIERNANQKRII